MSRIPAFRTYTFTNEEAAQKFSKCWKNIATSLRENHDVSTTSVFLSRRNPKQVHALVKYPVGGNPEQVMHGYVTSETLKQDTAGLDPKTFVDKDEIVMEEVDM